MSLYRVAAALTAFAVPLLALAAEPAAQPAAGSCEARPVVDRFVRAFNRGDLDELDGLFAQEGEGWSWYSVGDRAGRRALEGAKNRLDLVVYFDSRRRQHESLRLVRFKENGAATSSSR